MTLSDALKARYQDAAPPGEGLEGLARLAGRGSCRSFTAQTVPADVIRTLCAVALAAPSKSDLQQRDLILITDPGLKDSLLSRVAGQPWLSDVPHLLVVCANNRRQRMIHALHERPFVNDHVDAMFNAAVDAGIALHAFLTAAEAIGLGGCPISGLRNAPEDVSDLLGLPDYCFPVAGLAFGYPKGPPRISMRLPLAATVHENRFSEDPTHIPDYDAARSKEQPYSHQRGVAQFGAIEPYTWSEDKTRQYARPERSGFGAFLRARGFKLE